MKVPEPSGSSNISPHCTDGILKPRQEGVLLESHKNLGAELAL